MGSLSHFLVPVAQFASATRSGRHRIELSLTAVGRPDSIGSTHWHGSTDGAPLPRSRAPPEGAAAGRHDGVAAGERHRPPDRRGGGADGPLEVRGQLQARPCRTGAVRTAGAAGPTDLRLFAGRTLEPGDRAAVLA